MQVSLYLNNHIQNTINTALTYRYIAVIRSPSHVELESSKTAANSGVKVHITKSVILEAAAFFTVSRPGFEGYLQCHSAMVVSPVDGRKRGFKRMIICTCLVSLSVFSAS